MTNHITKDELLARISINPQICFGKPCIRGHRIWVSLILDLLAAGETMPDNLENYPGLEEADIRACLAYLLQPYPAISKSCDAGVSSSHPSGLKITESSMRMPPQPGK